MQTVTHGQVKDLVGRLPVQKLPIAYQFLADLNSRRTSTRLAAAGVYGVAPGGAS